MKAYTILLPKNSIIAITNDIDEAREIMLAHSGSVIQYEKPAIAAVNEVLEAVYRVISNPAQIDVKIFSRSYKIVQTTRGRIVVCNGY